MNHSRGKMAMKIKNTTIAVMNIISLTPIDLAARPAITNPAIRARRNNTARIGDRLKMDPLEDFFSLPTPTR